MSVERLVLVFNGIPLMTSVSDHEESDGWTHIALDWSWVSMFPTAMAQSMWKVNLLRDP